MFILNLYQFDLYALSTDTAERTLLLRSCYFSTVWAFPKLGIFHPFRDYRLELGSKVCDMEGLFVYNGWFLMCT